ncbi:MAG: Grx4 family monothiol glutaredoxin [Gammaproteobacteria bacterium]|nr:Grx4 family monothiol glutaredoxin [Gammaproteobacteria bacterium]MCY4227265.1 Grx4 family monothiol glutaredoxin [Gammaproteobacteria bacterium]
MSIQKQLKEVIESNEIILFMKGTPEFPQCGFSGRTAQILEACGVHYASVNVLADDAVREGIKQYSNWPTVPQLYIRGEFIGGCDIMMEMYENGELEKLIKAGEGEAVSAEQ